MKSGTMLCVAAGLAITAVSASAGDKLGDETGALVFVEDGPLNDSPDRAARLRSVHAPDASQVEAVADEVGGLWLLGKTTGNAPVLSFCRPTIPLHCSGWAEIGTRPSSAPADFIVIETDDSAEAPVPPKEGS